MKKLIMISILCVLFALPAYAETYKAITPDDTVETKGEVRVEQSETVDQKTVYTLDRLNAQKASVLAKIAKLQGIITELEATLPDIDAKIAAVDVEAKKVELKVKEVKEDDPSPIE